MAHTAALTPAVLGAVVLSAEVLVVAVLTAVDPSAAAHVEVALMVEFRTEAVHMVVVRTDMADVAKSKFQDPDLGIHHTPYFAHWFSIIYCLDGLVHDTVAYSQHLLFWECRPDIGDEFACPGKQVFQCFHIVGPHLTLQTGDITAREVAPVSFPQQGGCDDAVLIQFALRLSLHDLTHIIHRLTVSD